MGTAASASVPRAGGFRRVWRTLRELFHEMIGALFAVLAFGWANAALRAWTQDAARWLVATPLAVCALMVYFAFTSFRRARRVQ